MGGFIVGVAIMNNEEMDELEARVLKLIQHEIPIEEHTEHHTWVAVQMKKDLTIIARNEAITRHVLGWGIIALITALGTIVWEWLKGDNGING